MTESLRKKGSGKPAFASHRTPGTYMNLFIKPKRCICIKMILSLNDSVDKEIRQNDLRQNN